MGRQLQRLAEDTRCKRALLLTTVALVLLASYGSTPSVVVVVAFSTPTPKPSNNSLRSNLSGNVSTPSRTRKNGSDFHKMQLNKHQLEERIVPDQTHWCRRRSSLSPSWKDILSVAMRAPLSLLATSFVVFSALTFVPLPLCSAWAAATDFADTAGSKPVAESTLLQGSPTATSTQQQEASSSSVVDEVWNLINKYYIDRTFNGQDWDQIHTTTLAKAQTSIEKKDDKTTTKIVTDMVNTLGDKYTRMLTPDQYAAIQKFDLIGVGVTLMPSPQSKDIIVGAPPIEGSSSYRAGLQVGDYVVSVNGRPTRGRTAFDIIDQISEDPNAKTVTFGILRKHGESSLKSLGDVDGATTFDVTLDRQTMEVKDPVSYKLTESRKDGTKVGYVRVSEFNAVVQSSLTKALQELKQQGANAYVMDLRSNTGGAFQSAVEIAGLFLPPDSVATYVVDSNQVEMPFRTPKGSTTITTGGDTASSAAAADHSLPLVNANAPLVIWIDSLSASASEVLAGSLHDNCRAVTMGNTNSFGKGLIQAVYGLKNGAGLVLTVAKYVTPSGTEIQGIGLKPDVSGNMPAPVFIPGLSTDTSKVDFRDVEKRLSPDMCHVPKERVTTASTAAIATANVD